MKGQSLKPDRETSCILWQEEKLILHTKVELKAKPFHLSVNKHVRVPEGEVMNITMSPRRWVVNDILAWTCSKKLTPLQ
jgi:TRAP-type mannitol/chloroaromatic compound transport system permease small subunit